MSPGSSWISPAQRGPNRPVPRRPPRRRQEVLFRPRPIEGLGSRGRDGLAISGHQGSVLRVRELRAMDHGQVGLLPRLASRAHPLPLSLHLRRGQIEHGRLVPSGKCLGRSRAIPRRHSRSMPLAGDRWAGELDESFPESLALTTSLISQGNEPPPVDTLLARPLGIPGQAPHCRCYGACLSGPSGRHLVVKLLQCLCQFRANPP